MLRVKFNSSLQVNAVWQRGLHVTWAISTPQLLAAVVFEKRWKWLSEKIDVCIIWHKMLKLQLGRQQHRRRELIKIWARSSLHLSVSKHSGLYEIAEDLGMDGYLIRYHDFHCLVKSTSSWIACFTLDQISANYCINISQTICHCCLSIIWLMLSCQSVHFWNQLINDPDFIVRWSVTACKIVDKASNHVRR